MQSKREELAEINQDIKDRKKYRREQEAQIAEVLEIGNTKLMELNHDIELARKELRAIKTDTRTAKQDRRLAERDLRDLQQEIGQNFPGMANSFA